MGWFDKKPTGKEEPSATRPAEPARVEAPRPEATPQQEPMAAPPQAPVPPAEPDAPRGLAALFGQRQETQQAPATLPMPSESGSVFAESVEIEGSLEGEGDVYLRGQVRGSISITGTLVVAETGRVHADVAAREVVCGGTVEGNILATDKVRVQGTGLVQGDIDSPSIIIEDGGGVEGFVQMAPPGGDEQDDMDEPAPAHAPAAGRLGRSVRPVGAAATPAPPSQAPPAPAGPVGEAPQKLTREMLLGLSAAPPPAAGLLHRTPAAAAPSADGAMTTPAPAAPLDIFSEDESPILDASPLEDDVLGGGNGADGPLLPSDEHGAEPQKRPLPEL